MNGILNAQTETANCKGENEMKEERIKEIMSDIESYREAIADAEGALMEAERELDELMEMMEEEDEEDTIDSMNVAEFDDIEDYPEYNRD